ncbi:hypothetical protein M378DRAFT_163062 [Amanita muscaria Koide BX008]|uniref:Uncharacterized protein n=1 Tax=Amanita muscaria (strain Koide BX008) TaxID=946122 RepID=A0A0C2WSE7_AMAMK|nr:hypothetical protein M378DRAFT_163062 [Amanita muscaria Koide BX008]
MTDIHLSATASGVRNTRQDDCTGQCVARGHKNTVDNKDVVATFRTDSEAISPSCRLLPSLDIKTAGQRGASSKNQIGCIAHRSNDYAHDRPTNGASRAQAVRQSTFTDIDAC